MKNKVGILKNLIDEQTVEQIIQKYEMLPKKDDGLRFEADTLIGEDYSVKWKEKLQTILAPHHDADISYAGIFSDYAPGGIHSDGWIDSPQSLGYTFLIPLKFNYTNNATVVFEETSEKAVTFNEATGLGNLGILSYDQKPLPKSDKFLDPQFKDKWLSHIPENQLPFTVVDVLPWTVGSAVYFPRKNFHASAYFPTENCVRMGIVILTNE